MSERFRGGEPAVRGSEHHLEELVARLVHVDFLARDPGDVHVDMLGMRRTVRGLAQSLITAGPDCRSRSLPVGKKCTA